MTDVKVVTPANMGRGIKWNPNTKQYEVNLENLEDSLANVAAELSNKVSKSGDEMRGDLHIRANDWSGLNLYNLAGKHLRFEIHPDNAPHFGRFNYRNGEGSNEATIHIPKKNGTMALIEDIEAIANTVKASASRSKKSRTINGNSGEDNGASRQMQMDGEVVVYSDGKIEQFFHLKQFKDIWFTIEEPRLTAPGPPLGSNEERLAWGRLIPIPLWTAMPNKVLYVDAQLARSSSTTTSYRYVDQASNFQEAWAVRKQGDHKGQVWVDICKILHDSSAPMDLIVKVEGY